MARRRKLSSDARSEWCAEIDLAKAFYNKFVRDTSMYSRAAKNNMEHWKAQSWDYEVVTANYVYANQQSIMPRVLMRQPKVIVRPASRLTRAYMREGEAAAIDRFVAAARVQQICNWRVREFDFVKQVRRAVRDDHDRGMGIVQHGFLGIGDKNRTKGNKNIEFVNHKHMREGWPFVVHRSLDEVLWDQRARELDERRWVAFKQCWRPEDLKAYFNLREDPPVTEILGSDMYGIEERPSFEKDHGSWLGYTGVWEIWDRRTNEIIYWYDGKEEELCVEDWPLAFEGLPDSVLITNESNSRIEPIPEPSMYWELQQDLNRMLSLVLVYAKRGVPIIGYDANQLADGEAEKIIDAQVLELIKTKGNPNEALTMMNFNPVPQTLLLAINMVEGFLRQVSGIGKMQQGTRENVDTATEAAEIGQGGDARIAMRAEAVRKFFAEVVRKDWQVFQQTVQEDQILDIVVQGGLPGTVRVTREQVALEFDFDIQVGSSEPLNERKEQTEILAMVQALQADPQVYSHVNPRYLAERIVRAFGGDENEALATQAAANDQRVADHLTNQMNGGGGGGVRGAGLGAAQQALMARPDNAVKPTPGRT